MLLYLWCLHFLVILTACLPMNRDDGFELSIIHFNDFHARFEETSEWSTACRGVNCVGGISRVLTVVRQLLKERPDSISLNAGDNYQGTLWYTLFNYNVTQHFLNIIPTDAYTLGNHEFDDKIDGVVPFLKSIRAPFVVANLNDSHTPEIQGLYKKSLVLERNGRRIGIVGCIAQNTGEISKSEGLIFLDESESVNKESERLVAEENVDTVIVLSHAGYLVDQKIAKNASPKIGLIVGAHTHTFLYTGQRLPGPEKPEGPYPTIVNHADGRQILITQAAAFTKYIGNITVQYDNKGNVLDWSGAPIYLNKDIPQDEAMQEEIEEWKRAVDVLGNVVIGKTKSYLSQSRCRVAECSLGNLIADSMILNNLTPNKAEWAQVSIAIVNSGGIRSSIAQGNITYNDLVTCLPFGNTIDIVDVQGRYISQALEHAATAFVGQQNTTNFLQVSGIQVVYNLTQPEGSRVESLKMRCRRCSEPYYEKIDYEQYYRVALISFLADGGDGHTSISKNIRSRIIGEVDIDALTKYVKSNSPLTVKTDGRIKIVH